MQQDYNFLDRNEFNFKPSPLIVETFKNFDINKLSFYTRIYDEGKKSIFSVYLSELYGIDESNIVLGYGGEDILKQAVHFFLTRADNNLMLIPGFSWWYYKSLADEVNGETIEYPLYEDGDTFKYDIPGLKRQLKERKPAVLLLATPNNPTGNGLTPSQICEILDDVDESTIVVIDESYSSFVTDDSSYIAEITNKYPNVIFLRTLSKFYGLPGLRMGFAFLSPTLTPFIKFANKYLGYNRFSEEIAIAALKSTDHYKAIARSMAADRRRYKEEIGSLDGFKVYDSSANFILIKYPIELKEELKQRFADAHYKIKFMNDPGLETHLRITLGRPEQNDFVIRTIKEVASK